MCTVILDIIVTNFSEIATMSHQDRNQIRDFEYNLSALEHIHFLRIAFNIGFLLRSPDYYIEKHAWGYGGYYDLHTFSDGDSLKMVSLRADNL